ncbi:TspO/MBR family protein [Sutcliffiella horikoshii]|uniref:Tryptophan-rich sensory protein n=1 Tax=Sutcliffiella horikoshii TaxID=79883 RepID=A0AA94WMM7_9BACI|nr:TspO/MBR family protein [Sutcliffiella horikoshii]TYS58664.1 tryptophan-rich sensory protein [Sutcliffiella horikoshii]
MWRLLLNIAAFILVIVVNYLANALPLNGLTTGDIANRITVLFQPAGYVFSIWSLIYLLLGIWIIRQFPKSRRDLPIYVNTSGLFVLSCLLNSAWVVLWHYGFWVTTVVVMISLLLTLIALYTKMRESNPGKLDFATFSIYLGWISVATIANISYVLVEKGWNGFGLSDVTWTIIMLVVATLLAIGFRISQADWIYPLVFVWAFIGIGVKNMEDYSNVAYVAYALAAVILVITLLGGLVRKKS